MNPRSASGGTGGGEESVASGLSTALQPPDTSAAISIHGAFFAFLLMLPPRGDLLLALFQRLLADQGHSRGRRATRGRNSTTHGRLAAERQIVEHHGEQGTVGQHGERVGVT